MALDQTIDGVRVDVLQKRYKQLSGLPNEAKANSEKVMGGIPISPSDNPSVWGTLGLVVRQQGFPRYLTNSHVVGEPNSEIQQPASTESQDEWEIGKVSKWTEFNNVIDAALIRPTPGSRGYRLRIKGVEGRFRFRDLRLFERFDMELFKAGAKTGVTNVGTLKSIDAQVQIETTLASGFVATNNMEHQILVEAEQEVIQPGDSGSVLFTKGEHSGENFVVGLVHAQTEDEMGRLGFGLVACHIKEVMDHFGIDS